MKSAVSGLDGALIFASGIALHELERRKLDKHDHLDRRLLDPQLYLAGLDVAKAGKTCVKLASYGWFDGAAPIYDSSKEKQSDWRASAADHVKGSWSGTLPTDPEIIEDRVRICLDVQRRLGCEAIIVPTPLITTPSSDFSAQMAWLDPGLEFRDSPPSRFRTRAFEEWTHGRAPFSTRSSIRSAHANPRARTS